MNTRWMNRKLEAQHRRWELERKRVCEENEACLAADLPNQAPAPAEGPESRAQGEDPVPSSREAS